MKGWVGGRSAAHDIRRRLFEGENAVIHVEGYRGGRTRNAFGLEGRSSAWEASGAVPKPNLGPVFGGLGGQAPQPLGGGPS